MIEEPKAVFIGWTRSFWAFALALLFLLSGIDDATARALGELLAGVVGADPVTWGEWFSRVPPVALMLVGWHQRSGAARPYTLDPRALE
jgi:hypothetical protein